MRGALSLPTRSLCPWIRLYPAVWKRVANSPKEAARFLLREQMLMPQDCINLKVISGSDAYGTRGTVLPLIDAKSGDR